MDRRKHRPHQFIATETPIPTDSNMLVVLGLVGLAVVWLVFSLVRKLFGLLLLAALAVGGLVLWSNPELLSGLLGTISNR